MRNKQDRYNDMIDASFRSWKTLTEEQREEMEHNFERIDRYKKFSAMAIGYIYATVVSIETPFWIAVICAITAILAVNVVWQIIGRWATERLGLDG